jgi:hypothetical protein
MMMIVMVMIILILDTIDNGNVEDKDDNFDLKSIFKTVNNTLELAINTYIFNP